MERRQRYIDQQHEERSKMTKEQIKIKDRSLTLPIDSKIEIGIANVLGEKTKNLKDAHKWFGQCD